MKAGNGLVPISEYGSPADPAETLPPSAASHPSLERRLESTFHWNNHGRRGLDRNAYLFNLVWGDSFYRQKEWLSVRGTHWAHADGNDEPRGVYQNIRCDWAPCGRILENLAELREHSLEHIDSKFQVPKHVRSQWCLGRAVDILDGEMIWYPARIIDATPGRFLIRYDDEQWSYPEFDEWVWKDSPRLAPRGCYTASKRGLPPGTFLPQPSVIAPREETRTHGSEHAADSRQRFRYYAGRAHRKRATNAGIYRR